MRVEGSETNADLARLLHARIAAEDSRVTWRAIGLRMAGVVGAVVLGGAGVASAALGVATLVRARPDTESVARHAAAIAMGGHEVRVRGTVSASGEVALAQGGTVGMDPSSSVKLAEGARVRLLPEDQPPRPTEAQMKATEPQARSDRKVATNYTVFKSVDYGKGRVVTGWNYTASDQDRPVTQYCYYSESLDGTTSARIELGADGAFVSPRSTPSVNARDAFGNCVWY